MKDAWERRHAQGGPFNERLVREDGTIAPHAYTVDPATGCHLWNYSLSSKYRGVPQAGGFRSVRRVVWKTAGKGPLPRHVGVSCDNDRCINPDHLVAENRAQRRSRKMGEALAAGDDPVGVAARFGVGYQAVSEKAREVGVVLPRREGRRNAAKRAALTEPPAGVTDREWDIYAVCRDHNLAVAADAFRLTRQRVAQVADRVIAIATGAKPGRVRWAEEVIGTPDEGCLEGGL